MEKIPSCEIEPKSTHKNSDMSTLRTKSPQQQKGYAT